MKIKARIPTKMEDVTLDQYQQWVAVAEKEGQSADFLEEKLIQYFTRLPQLAVTRMKRSQYREVLQSVKGILSEQPGFTPTFRIDGVDYGFIPDMSDDILTGEWIDLSDFMKSWATMHKALAVMYRPITARKGDRYMIQKYTSRIEIKLDPDLSDQEKLKKIEELERSQAIMKDLPLDIAMGAVLFFWKLARQLLTVTPKYFQREIQKKEVQAVLQKSGAGTAMSTISLEHICGELMKLLPPHWESSYSLSLMIGTTKRKSSAA